MAGAGQGIRLPSVSLPATDGSMIDLAKRPGRLLLIVYPYTGRPGHPNPPRWDETEGAHGSTPELEGFRDLADDFAARGIALFGLSRQNTGWQSELAERLELTFPLLSDREDRLWPALGLETFETGGEIYLARITLLIEDGIVLRRFHAPDPANHAARMLTLLR